MESTPHNIYIHVPFCMSKCRYCAFYSSACANPDWGAYANGIISEINRWHDLMGRLAVPTIFFGGGTPSLMPATVFGRIMDTIAGKFNIAPNAEVTMESNPGTIDGARLGDFVAAGANRLSVGVQSLDNDRLRWLGRMHDADAARALIDAGHNLGMRVSADFIYGLPGDTADTVIKMCGDINSLGLRHCSMYELTIEPDTPLGQMNLNMPTNEEMADMFCAISQHINLARYEVSNYRRDASDECRHNANIWDGGAYIGLGRGAAGRVYMNGVWHEQMGAGELFAPMAKTARTMEKIITGMRTIRGVEMTAAVRDAIDMDFVDAHNDLVQISHGRIRATEKGLLILDNLLLNLIG